MFGLTNQRKYNTLQKEYEALKTKIKIAEQLSIVSSSLRQEINSLQGQLAEIKKQIREQNEADLFFISAKIQKKLLNGEPKENVQDLYLQQRTYQKLLAQQQVNFYPPNSFLSGLGLSGLGGLFGK